MSNAKVDKPLKLDNNHTNSNQDGKPTSARREGIEKRRTQSRDSSTCKSPCIDGEKKLPPIKAPVGLAKGPDLKNVKSKIGSFSNVKHKPLGGEKKVITQKLEWNAKSKIGSLENSKHKAGGGDVKVQTQKLDWKMKPKVGSLSNITHKPGGGQVKIFDEKYARTGSASPGTIRSPSPAHSNKSLGTESPAPAALVANMTAASSTDKQNGDSHDKIEQKLNTNIEQIRDLHITDHKDDQNDLIKPQNINEL